MPIVVLSTVLSARIKTTNHMVIAIRVLTHLIGLDCILEIVGITVQERQG